MFSQSVFSEIVFSQAAAAPDEGGPPPTVLPPSWVIQCKTSSTWTQESKTEVTITPCPSEG